MFLGVNALKLDAKGRLAIPSKYRKALAASDTSSVIVTINPHERCLWLYPEVEWQDIMHKVMRLPSTRHNANFKRLLLGHAVELVPDGQGRVLLAKHLRTYAGLQKEVALVGQGHKFELWDMGTWNEQCGQWLEEIGQAGDIADDLANLAL